MAFQQRELDKLIILRNKNESALSPFKNTSLISENMLYKNDRSSNRDFEFINKQSIYQADKFNLRTAISDNYYDIQHKYVKDNDNPCQNDIYNQFLFKKQGDEGISTKNHRFNEETQSERINPKMSIMNAGSQISSLSPYTNFPTYSSISSLNQSPIIHYGKLDTEYSKYVKYNHHYPQTEEYNRNKVLGYGRNLIGSPKKDYAKIFIRGSN